MRKKICRLFLFGFLFAWMVSLFAQSSPIIIDTDAAIDDMQAITYLLNQPSVNILAISLDSNGEANCISGLQHIAGLLTLMDRKTIPFACGTAPSLSSHEFPKQWRQEANTFLHIALPPSSLHPQNVTAAQLIINSLQASSQQVTIIELGTFSNLASAYQNKPQLLRKKITAIYSTGGNFKVSSSLKRYLPYPSWNYFIDPVAAKIMLQSKIPFYMATTEAFAILKVPYLYSALSIQTNSKATQLVHEILKRSQHDWFIADQFTAAWALHPEICDYQIIRTQILTQPTSLAGLTIVNQHGDPAYACLQPKSQLFYNVFVNGLK